MGHARVDPPTNLRWKRPERNVEAPCGIQQKQRFCSRRLPVPLERMTERCRAGGIAPFLLKFIIIGYARRRWFPKLQDEAGRGEVYTNSRERGRAPAPSHSSSFSFLRWRLMSRIAARRQLFSSERQVAAPTATSRADCEIWNAERTGA